MYHCKAIGCSNPVTDPTQDFCQECRQTICDESDEKHKLHQPAVAASSLVDKNPHHFRSVEHLTEVDPYAIHHLFNLNDPSGALQHASRKLLLSGGPEGYPDYEDIREARDTLTRWLELNTTLH